MTSTIEIPNKSLFKMNEVCGLTGVKPYVLRFWESEFDQIAPISSSSGQKLYEHKDIEAIALVKKLLFDEKMTIEKAKSEIAMRYQESRQASEDQQITPSQTTAAPLSEKDIQRLVMAKKKLGQIVELADSLKERHHWS